MDLVQRPQRGQRETVVPAEGDELRLGQQGRHGAPAAQLREGLGHLLQGHGIVDGHDGDVAAVEDGRPVLVRVDARPGVEAPKGRLPGRGMANGAGAKPCACWRLSVFVRHERGGKEEKSRAFVSLTRSVAHSRIKRGAHDGDVEQLGRVRQALDVLEMGKAADPSEWPLQLTRHPPRTSSVVLALPSLACLAWCPSSRPPAQQNSSERIPSSNLVRSPMALLPPSRGEHRSASHRRASSQVTQGHVALTHMHRPACPSRPALMTTSESSSRSACSHATQTLPTRLLSLYPCRAESKRSNC